MTIRTQEVAHMAALARLEIPEAALTDIAGELDRILHYMEQISEIPRAESDEDDPGPCAAGDGTPLRSDEPGPSNAFDLLEQAPDREGEFFRVPRIL